MVRGGFCLRGMTRRRDGEMRRKDSSTVNFDDQDWDLEEGLSRPRPDPTVVWRVAAGVAVGIVIGGALVWAVDHRGPWPGARTPPPATEAMRPAAEAGAITTPLLPLHLPAEPTGAGLPAQPPGLIVASELGPAEVRSAAVVPQDVEVRAALALRTTQHAAERKERAWVLFYKKPAACDESPPKASMVECANHFIRAKREFEQLYADGKPVPSRPADLATRSASAP